MITQVRGRIRTFQIPHAQSEFVDAGTGCLGSSLQKTKSPPDCTTYQWDTASG